MVDPIFSRHFLVHVLKLDEMLFLMFFINITSLIHLNISTVKISRYSTATELAAKHYIGVTLIHTLFNQMYKVLSI